MECSSGRRADGQTLSPAPFRTVRSLTTLHFTIRRLRRALAFRAHLQGSTPPGSLASDAVAMQSACRHLQLSQHSELLQAAQRRTSVRRGASRLVCNASAAAGSGADAGRPLSLLHNTLAAIPTVRRLFWQLHVGASCPRCAEREWTHDLFFSASSPAPLIGLLPCQPEAHRTTTRHFRSCGAADASAHQED